MRLEEGSIRWVIEHIKKQKDTDLFPKLKEYGYLFEDEEYLATKILEIDIENYVYKKLLDLICRNKEKLRATMTDEQKELFAKYTNCAREYQTLTDCLIFQNSFKLGARMVLEVMEE